MRPGFWQYVRAAFNARPIGMFVPPNWIGLAAIGMLGYFTNNPGYWLLGAGLEMGYLSLLATNPRFQRLVAGSRSLGGPQSPGDKVQQALRGLPPGDRERYQRLELGCQSVLHLQFGGGSSGPGYQMQAESLGRLTWMYLRLLATRQAIQTVIQGSAADTARAGPRTRGGPPPLPTQESRHLEARLAELRQQLEDQTLSPDLRRSLTQQVELIQQRVDRRATAMNKVAFIEAELTRVEQQVALIREQAVLSTDPQTFSQRIDEVGATLSGTADWIAEQQRTLGALDFLTEPAPVAASASRAKESQ